jgi:hypothetical protein
MAESPDVETVTWVMPRQDARDLLRWLRHNRPLGMPDSTFDGLIAALRGAGLPEPSGEERAKWERHTNREIERALREAQSPEDSMATDDDLLRYAGRDEAVEIFRAMYYDHATDWQEATP